MAITDNIGIKQSDKDAREALGEMGIPEDTIYDQTPSVDDIYSIPVVDGLTDEELEVANMLRRFYYGVMLVVGPTRSGKGLFVTWLFHLFKRYFGRRILMDYKPRPLFGPYIPFNEDVLVGELSKVRRETEIDIPTRIPRNDQKTLKDMRGLAEQWLAEKGEIYLRGAALGLDELKRYFHNRNPHNPMGVTLGHLLTTGWHWDLLLVGMCPYKREIDAISFLPYVTHEVRCSWGTDGKGHYNIYQTRWIGRKGILEARGRPFRMALDGAKPRHDLDGERLYDLYNTKDPKAIRPSKSIMRSQ